MTDHIAAARELLDRLTPDRDTGPGMGRGYWSTHEAQQVDALRAIGHALLAINDTLGDEECPPLPGWTEITGQFDTVRTFARVHTPADLDLSNEICADMARDMTGGHQ